MTEVMPGYETFAKASFSASREAVAFKTLAHKRDILFRLPKQSSKRCTDKEFGYGIYSCFIGNFVRTRKSATVS
jgi:hypothetical protein